MPYSTQHHFHRNLSHSTLSCKGFLKSSVAIAIQSHSWFQFLRHTLWKDTIAHSTVYTESFQCLVLVEETKSVAIGKGSSSRHIERVSTYLLYLPHILAHGLRGIDRGNILSDARNKIVGKTPIESLT